MFAELIFIKMLGDFNISLYETVPLNKDLGREEKELLEDLEVNIFLRM